MPSWELEKIIQTDVSVESVSPKGSLVTKRIRSIFKNPSLEQIWFYHIKNKNIEHLQSMIDDNVVDIDQKDQDGGGTIIHDAIYARSIKLLDFCIKNDANFYIQSAYDEETGYYEASYPYVSYKIFCKVWSTIEKKSVLNELMKENGPGILLIQKLCSDNKNIKKILWIEKTFPEAWESLKADKMMWDHLIGLSKEKNADEVFLFLKGLKKIKNELERDLQNKAVETKRLKV